MMDEYALRGGPDTSRQDQLTDFLLASASRGGGAANGVGPVFVRAAEGRGRGRLASVVEASQLTAEGRASITTAIDNDRGRTLG